MKLTEVIDAYGHESIQSKHENTLEITKETALTRRGDCIIAVGATKGAADLHSSFKQAAKKEDAKITITIEVDGLMGVVRACGSPQLLFTHPTDMVVRKSDYVCGRTIAIRADKAASDLPRKLVEKMRNPNQTIKITLTVENY